MARSQTFREWRVALIFGSSLGPHRYGRSGGQRRRGARGLSGHGRSPHRIGSPGGRPSRLGPTGTVGNGPHDVTDAAFGDAGRHRRRDGCRRQAAADRPAGQSERISAPGSTRRSRSSSGRWRSSAPRSTSGTRSVHNRLCRRDLGRRAPSSSRSWTKCRPDAPVVFSATACKVGPRPERSGATCSIRRHLPAGLQGPSGGRRHSR